MEACVGNCQIRWVITEKKKARTRREETGTREVCVLLLHAFHVGENQEYLPTRISLCVYQRV